MLQEVADELLDVFTDVEPPFSGSIADFALKTQSLPESYAITGPANFYNSPWLIAPLEAVQNPKVETVFKCSAIQTAKSTTDEAGAIPYWITQAPGPVLRIHQDDIAAEKATEDRLFPALLNNTAVAPLLSKNSLTKKGIKLPHMYIRVAGDKESVSHGGTYRYLILDDAHLFEPGLIQKLIGRTNAFAGRRKIIIASQPNIAGSDLETIYNSGLIFQWQWCCPNCKQHQAYVWSKEREDGTYAGFNWDTILKEDGKTNIDASARTTWLECFHCRHEVHDNASNRRYLNESGKYVCIKADGNYKVHSYTWPQIVNVNLSFESFATQFLNAKRIEKNTGLKEPMVTFKNQVMGEFYHRKPDIDLSKLVVADYSSTAEWNDEGVRIMTVDIQRSDEAKYYIIRAWNKHGTESRLLDLGITHKWEDLKRLQTQWKIQTPCMGIDCGDGPNSAGIYAKCIVYGETYKGMYERVNWVPLKGDQEKFYKHDDGKIKLYSVPFQGDPLFANDTPYKGLYVRGYRWSNYSVKTILANLRDGRVPGVKWLTNVKDAVHESHMWSEGIVQKVNKKTGLVESAWEKHTDQNHFFDAEAMNLTMAIMLKYFTSIDIEEGNTPETKP